MASLSGAFSEIVELAGHAAPHSLAGAPEPDPHAVALHAIDVAIAEARASGTRAAVCVAAGRWLATDEPLVHDERSGRSGALGPLRGHDRLIAVDDGVVIVAAGIRHPHDAEVMAERVRQAGAGSSTPPPAVGLALYPNHGADSITLLASARASAHRAGQRRLGHLAGDDD